MKRITLEPCFVLHSRPYRNTSLIVELLSEHHGRVTAVARSARGPSSRYKGCLQAFVPLLISWSGRHELMQLGVVEILRMPYQLEGKALLSGFYLNELLMRLLAQHDGASQIFEHYCQTLQALVDGASLQHSLRRFEKALLACLGYGVVLNRDYQNNVVEAGAVYTWMPEHGLMRVDTSSIAITAHCFHGYHLLAWHQEHFQDPMVSQQAKRFMRLVMAHYLNGKPLKSRELMC